jgi:hypothetical protein
MSEVAQLGVRAARARLNHEGEEEVVRLLHELHRVAEVARQPHYQLHLVSDDADSEGGEAE